MQFMTESKAGTWLLGERLRAAREALNLSQTAAAQRADFSRTVWQQLESGQRADGKPLQPKAKTVTAAALAVQLDPREALRLAGHDPTRYEPSRAGRPVASQSELSELFTKLNERQRQALIELVASFVDQQDEPPSSQQSDAVDTQPPTDDKSAD
jgi:transcriptional regulator with XRE-family HTH domain